MKIITPLIYKCSFQYKSVYNNGLIENEIDHVFYGVSNQVPVPDPKEVSDWKYIKPDQLIKEININPEHFTTWLKICIDRNIFKDLIETEVH